MSNEYVDYVCPKCKQSGGFEFYAGAYWDIYAQQFFMTDVKDEGYLPFFCSCGAEFEETEVVKVKKPRMKKTIIHVNQHNIRHNTKGRDSELPYDHRPVLTVKDYKHNRIGDEVLIYGQDGEPAARIVYSPDKPLSCGARVWIETFNKVEVV